MTQQEIIKALRNGLTATPALMDAAADLIEALTAELEEARLTHRTEHCDAADYDCVELGRLRKELEQVKQERDNVARREDDCPHCAHRDEAPTDCDLECLRCENPCICYKCRDGDRFEWCGVQEGGAEDA